MEPLTALGKEAESAEPWEESLYWSMCRRQGYIIRSFITQCPFIFMVILCPTIHLNKFIHKGGRQLLICNSSHKILCALGRWWQGGGEGQERKTFSYNYWLLQTVKWTYSKSRGCEPQQDGFPFKSLALSLGSEWWWAIISGSLSNGLTGNRWLNNFPEHQKYK